MNLNMIKGILLGAKHGIKQNLTHDTPWALIDPSLATIMSTYHDIRDVTGKNSKEQQRGTIYEMGSDLGAYLGTENPVEFLNKPKEQQQQPAIPGYGQQGLSSFPTETQNGYRGLDYRGLSSLYSRYPYYFDRPSYFSDYDEAMRNFYGP